MPAFAIRLALGELADALLLSGQRVLPERATALGYRFTYPAVDGALENIVRSTIRLPLEPSELPTMRYRTPRALSASSRARSDEVRTSSNTSKTATKALSRGQFERPEGVIDIAGVYSRIFGRDEVRFTPQRLAVQDPGTLAVCQLLDF